MASSPNNHSKWPKLRKILFTKPMPKRRYTPRPPPVNDPPEIHVPKAIPLEDYTDENSSSQNPLPINGTQEQNADESAKIFEKINKNLLDKILTPQQLFGTPTTNSDDNSKNEKENGETTAGKNSSNEKTGNRVEDEKQVFELIDLTSADTDNIAEMPTTEPVELYDDTCMPNVENDLAGETGKRKPPFPCLNIMTESSIRIVPGGYKNPEDPRINKSGNRRSTEENLQKEDKGNSSRTKEATANGVSERRRSSTHSVKNYKESFVEEISKKESVKRENDVMSTTSSNKPKMDPREINTGFNKHPESKIKTNFNESPFQESQKSQPDEKSSMESRKEKTVEKTRETAQEKTNESQKHGSTSGPESPSPESTIIRKSSAELSRVDNTNVKEMLAVGNSEKSGSVKNTHETAAFCAKTRSSVETTELPNIGNTNIDKILEMEHKKSNPEKNTSETMTFYSNNDQTQYNHSNRTVDEIPSLQENNANNNATENEPDDRISLMDATSILCSVIEDKVRSMMKSELIALLVQNTIGDIRKNHSVLSNDIVSQLCQQQKNIYERQKQTNRNDTAINQEASPNLNPVEEINSENGPSSIPENLTPTQIFQHQTSETHVLPPPPLPPTLSTPEHNPISPSIPWCTCGNPACRNNQQMILNLQRMGLGGNVNSFPLANQFPMIYSQLNNCNYGRGCPPNERQHNSNVPVDHSHMVLERVMNNCHGIPPNIFPLPKSPQKRTYNKKRKAGNEIPATQPAKRVRKPRNVNTVANQLNRRRNSTGSQMTLATAIDSFHEATSNHGVYSENNAHSAYLNRPQEAFPNHNFNYGSSTMDHRSRVQADFRPQPQQIQNFPHFMQNQNSNAQNIVGHNHGRPPLDFNLARLCPPPASIVQDRIQSDISADNDEEQQRSSVMSSPIIPLQYVTTSYEHPQPELELRADIYQQIPVPNANDCLIFKTPEDHQKYLAQQQAHHITFQN